MFSPLGLLDPIDAPVVPDVLVVPDEGALASSTPLMKILTLAPS